MPIYSITAPNGKTYNIEGPEGATQEQVIREILARDPAAGEATKRSTVTSELVRGAKNLVSTSRTGLESLVAPEEAAIAGAKRSEAIDKEAGEGASLDRLKRVYNKDGMFAAAKEAVTSIPGAIASQAPQIAAMAGGARLGATAGGAFGPYGALVGGALGAGATLLPQFAGANVERQASEQLEKNEPVKIDRGAAYSAAAGQAALEGAGTAFTFGKRIVKSVLGIADDAALLTAKVQAELVKTAQRSLAASAGKAGAKTLAVEMPVELAQTVLERAQAGMSLTSEDALSEYGETLYQTGLSSGPIGSAVGAYERRYAKQKLAEPTPDEAPAITPLDAAAAAEVERRAQGSGKRIRLPENDLFALASGPNGYAEVAKYKASLLPLKKTPEVKAALKEADDLLMLMGVESVNRQREAEALRGNDRGLPTPETSAFNAPAETAAATAETPVIEAPNAPATETAPEPKVRKKKGAKNVAVPPVNESGEATATEQPGAGTTVPSVGVDSQPNADAPAVQTETAGVGVSELPAADGNATEGLTGSTVELDDGKSFKIVAHTDSMFALEDANGNVTRATRAGKLGKAIEAKLGIIPVETTTEVTTETPTVEAPIEQPAEESTNPFADLSKQLPVLEAVEAPLEPAESLESLKEQQTTLRDAIAADKKSQRALHTPGGALLPANKAGFDELQKTIDQTQQKLDALQEQIKAAKKTKGRTVAPTRSDQIARNKEWFKEQGQREKPEGASAEIQGIIEAVGAYNNPESDTKRRYVATDYLYAVATEPNQKPSVKQFALRALRNAVDPMDMRPSLRPKYDELVRNVDDDNTDWGSYRYAIGINNLLSPEEQLYIEQSLDRKPLQYVADWMAVNAPSKVHRAVAQKIKQRMLEMQAAGFTFDFRIVRPGEMAPAALSGAGGLTVTQPRKDKITATVYLPSKEVNPQGMHYETITHELVHAVSEIALHVAKYKVADNTAAQALLIDLRSTYNAVSKHINARIAAKAKLSEIEQAIYSRTTNTMNDTSELLAWGLTNREFQEYLDTIPYTAKQSVWSKFVEAIRSFLGMRPNTNSALAEVLRIGEEIMSTPIQDTVRGIDEFYKSPSKPVIVSSPIISTPGAVAATQQADVIGDTAQRTAMDEVRRAVGKVSRVELVDRLSNIDAKLTAGYLGRLRDAVGNINPKELLAQALDAPRLVERALVEGFLSLTPDGMFMAAKGRLADGTEASMKRIVDIISKSAKQKGWSFAEENKVLSGLIVGHREFELDKYNNLPTTPVPIQLRIDDPVKRNELERQYQANPDAKKVVEIMDTMRHNRIDMMVYSGRISQDKADFWKSTLGYVPYQDLDKLNDRINAKRTGTGKGLSSTSKYFQISGDITQVGNVVDSFVDLMSRMTADAVKVNAVNRGAEAMRLLGHARRISPAASLSQAEKEHTVDTFVNGRPARYFFDDPLDAAAFAAIPNSVSSVMQVMQGVARVLRAGVTLVPGFAVGQVLTDLTRAYALSDVANPAALIPRILMNFPVAAFGEVTGRKRAAIVKLENMGVAATFDVSTQGTIKNIMQEVGAEKRGIGGAIMHFAESVSKASDIAVRQAIYEQSLKETGDEALSMSRAREIINFSRRGKNNTVDFLVRTVPFTNAYIRGMDKLYTAATGSSGAYGMTQKQARQMFRNRIGTLAAIGTVYAMMMAGDDEYEALDDNIRDSRFILPFKIDGAMASIPLPRDLAFIFKAIPERVVNYVRKYGTEEEQNGMLVVGELMRQGLFTFAAPSTIPSMVTPLLENVTNHSFFLDRPLESQSQQGKESFMASGRGTSEVAKEIGNGLSTIAKQFKDMGLDGVASTFEVSPVKIENLIRGWFGTSAALALAMGDELLAPERTAKSPHKEVLAQITGMSALMTDPVGRKQLNDFYDLHEKVAKFKKSLNELEKTDPERAIEYAKERVPEMEVVDYVEMLHKDIQKRNETIRMIDREKNMDPDEKLKAVSEIVREQNEIAKAVVDIKRHLLKRE